MSNVLVDSNVIFDIWDRDPIWTAWSSEQLRRLSYLHDLAINPIIYAEISPRFSTVSRLDERLEEMRLVVLSIPRQAAFHVGRAFAQYRLQGGKRGNVLADFFIGAHAAAIACPLLTRDTRHYSSYFPNLALIAP
jgi:predicted nucleic acid-binding protein